MYPQTYRRTQTPGASPIFSAGTTLWVSGRGKERAGPSGELLTVFVQRQNSQMVAELVPGEVHPRGPCKQVAGPGWGRWSSGGGGAAEPGDPPGDSCWGGWCTYHKKRLRREGPCPLQGSAAEAREKPRLGHPVNAFRRQPDAGRNWDTIRKRDLQGSGMTVAVLEISGLCQSGRMRRHTEPVSSSEGGAGGLNRCPSWAEMPGTGRWPRSLRRLWL